MIRPRNAALLSILSALALASAASAKPPHHRGMHPGDGMMMHHSEVVFRHLDELGLTAEQKSKVAEIRKKGEEQATKLRDEAHAAHLALMTGVKNDASTDDLKKLFETMQDKSDALEDHRFSQMMEVRDVLTAEQRKKASEKVAKHMDRMESKRSKKE